MFRQKDKVGKIIMIAKFSPPQMPSLPKKLLDK